MLPSKPGRILHPSVLLAVGCCLVSAVPTSAGASDEVRSTGTGEEAGVVPSPVVGSRFEGLLANPPFSRSLGGAGSIILTGLAQIDGERVATLLDTTTGTSHVVTTRPNQSGWVLLELVGDASDLEDVRVRVQIDGGEVVDIRHAELPLLAGSPRRGGGSRNSGSGNLRPQDLEEARKAAVNYRAGFSSDGFPREPPREIVEKLSRLSVDQREALNRRMIGLRNEGLGMEERRRIYVETLDRSVRSR